MDEDIKGMDTEKLKNEVIRLRNGIRYHRDQRGDDRCWLDDLRLYSLLDDKVDIDASLPPKNEFLKSCARFWESRQENPVYEKAKIAGKEVDVQIKALLANKRPDGKSAKDMQVLLAKFISENGFYFEADSYLKAELRKEANA